MKRNNNPLSCGFGPWTAITRLVVSVVLGSLLVVNSNANNNDPNVYTLTPTPGGVPAQASITSLAVTSTNATLCWYGMRGLYAVEMSTDLVNYSVVATNIAASDYAWCVTVTNTSGDPNALFRLRQSNSYVGAGGCAGCHGDKYQTYLGTKHASAYDSITNLTGSDFTNALISHTVGYGQPTGFSNIVATPHLKNVGCENCHGPAGFHKYNEHTLLRPAVTYASEVCAGCHVSAQIPQYLQWTNSPHFQVVPNEAAGFLSTNIAAGSSEIGSSGDNTQLTCGKCHSGATRLAMLADYKDRIGRTNVIGGVTNIVAGVTNPLVIPSATDAATYAQTCATCHDPHEKANPYQLRNPLWSTNFYTLSTASVLSNIVTTNVSSLWYTTVTNNITNYWLTTTTNKSTNTVFWNTPFATNYNPTVQICGQCHNSRGATWGPATTASSRPPHHSCQYNILIGSVQAGYLNGTNSMPGLFGANTNGCAQCHMHAADHKFEFSLEGMMGAGNYADTNAAEVAIEGYEATTTNLMNEVITLLDRWSASNAPAINPLFTNYYRAWEFTTAGQLSNPTGTNTWLKPGSTNVVIVGPSGTLQAVIPQAVQKARFNLYLVEHDGSKGVHNPDYATYLLNNAKTNVNSLLPVDLQIP